MDVMQADLDMEFIEAFLTGKTVQDYKATGRSNTWRSRVDYKAKFTYKLTEEDVKKCLEFADLVTPHTFLVYKERHRSLTIEECHINHFNGKLAEIAAVNYLRSKGFTCEDPDFSLHKRRSYDSDTKATHLSLPSRVLNVHVKSQTESFMRWTETPSYAFTIGDSLITNPTYDDFVLMTVIKENSTVDIVDMMKAESIFPHFIKPLKKPSKQRVAIYYSDIQESLKGNT